MTCTIGTKSTRHLSAKLAAGLAISAFLLLGTFVAPARADNNHHGDWQHNNERGYSNWGGSYYVSPPVYYGPQYYSPPPNYYAPSYYPPPVVYAPGIGISVPGISIGIQ
jgi:hypothetical protein